MDTNQSIPATQLPPLPEGEVFCSEWHTYREELARLLREGHDGEFILIKGRSIVGIFPNWEAARKAGVERFSQEPFFVHVIRSSEPVLRIRGISLPCRG